MMDSFSNVADSLCVGQKLKDDERVVLFVKMAPDQKYVQMCFYITQIVRKTQYCVITRFLKFLYLIDIVLKIFNA